MAAAFKLRRMVADGHLALVSLSGGGHNRGMPSNGDLDALVFLAEEARKEDSWLEFSRFCGSRGRGVRAAAMEHLTNFLQTTVSWPLEERLVFSKWVLWRSRNFSDDRVVLPDTLRKELLVPTLRSWVGISPGAAEAHLWLGLLGCDDPFSHLEQALKLDPSCELARQGMIDGTISDIEYNQHELPGFYINDPVDDLKELERASELASGSTAEAKVQIWQQAIAELRARAEDWLARKGRSNNVIPFPGETTRAVHPGKE